MIAYLCLTIGQNGPLDWGTLNRICSMMPIVTVAYSSVISLPQSSLFSFQWRCFPSGRLSGVRHFHRLLSQNPCYCDWKKVLFVIDSFHLFLIMVIGKFNNACYLMSPCDAKKCKIYFYKHRL